MLRILRLRADLVGARVDQRGVLQVLVGQPLDRVEGQQRRHQVEAAAVREGRVVQEGANRLRIVVQQAVGPQRLLLDVPPLEQRRGLLEPVTVLHPPGDLVEVQAVEVGLVEEGEDLLRRAVLGDPGPGGLVDPGSGARPR